MRLIGECPRKYGSHSLRIGGATALADRIADRIAGIEIGVFGVNDQSGGSDAQNGSSEGVN